MKRVTAVELFAGIGGFRIAADLLNIKTLWANDIDPKACAVYRDRFGRESIVEGDIRIHLNEIPPHDLLTAGFPCQPFSSAGKKQGVADPRGTLFEVVVDVLDTLRPCYFVLENVKRLLEMQTGVHFGTILNSLSQLQYAIEWRLLNTANLGLAQNRQRVFITGTRVDKSWHASNFLNGFIRLASKSDLAAIAPKNLSRLLSPKCWLPLEKHAATFPNWGLCFQNRFFAVDLDSFSEKQPAVLLADVMEEQVDEKFDFTETTLKWLHKNSPVNRFVDGVEILSNQGGGARMGYTIFGTKGVAPTLTATPSRHYERYKIGDRYRRLTNVEYARLQGFPDDHCRTAAVYNQYALYGNAVPPPLAKWVISKLLGEGVHVPTDGIHIQLPLLTQ